MRKKLLYKIGVDKKAYICILKTGKRPIKNILVMTKYILAVSLTAILSLCMPCSASANAAIEIIENDQLSLGNVAITIEGTSVRVVGAAGQTLYIYNVAGVRIHSVKVDGADKRLDLNLQKGCYILKVGNTVRKISLK